MDNKTFALTIDGPVAAGKGTIAVKVANALKGFHLNTGAMYRCLALFCLENHIDFADQDAVVAALKKINISFQEDKAILNGAEVNEKLKSNDVANGASLIATYPNVRVHMVGLQQSLAKEMMAKGQIVVLEGRDTGTKVFPQSPLKVYLTADAEIRAERRLSQYRGLGRDVSLEEMIEEIKIRDKRDRERSADPLPSDPAALGYFILDDSNLDEEKTVQTIIDELEKRGLIVKG